MSVVVIKKRVPKIVTIVKRSLLSVPFLLSVTPNMGATAGGTSVTLSGYGFTGANASSLLQPGFTVVDDTTITGVTVAHAAGVVSATVSNASYTSAALANAFTYTAGSAPTVTSASLASVPWRATAITLTGTGFVSGATVDMSVDSGSTWTACTSVTFGSSTSLTATTPVQTANAANTVVRFRVTNPDLQTGTLGAGNVAVLWDPLDSANKLWTKAGAGVTTVGGHVTKWADQGSHGNDATGTGTWTVVNNWSNGQPALNTDGATTLDNAIVSLLTSPKATGALCFVLDNPGFAAGGAGASLMRMGAGGATAVVRVLDQLVGSQNIYGDQATVNERIAFDRAAFAGPTHVEWVFNGGNGTNLVDHYIAGVQETISSGFQSTQTAFGADGFQIGGADGFFWGSDSHIAEVYFFDHVPSANELAGWTAYVKTKYGLAA